jgi:hypothetical protein
MSKTLEEILDEHEKRFCSNCKREITIKNISYYNQETEFGTPHCMIEIICECGKLIQRLCSWWPAIENNDELLYVLDSDWEAGC